MNRIRLLFVVLAAVLVGGVACAPRASPPPASITVPTQAASITPESATMAPSSVEIAWQKVVDAARKESRVMIYSTFATPDWQREFGRLLREKYGLQADFIQGDGVTVGERIATEQRSGQEIADLIWTGGSVQEELQKKRLLQNFRPPIAEQSPADIWTIGPFFYDKDTMTTVDRVAGFTAGINTRLVKPQDYPSSWLDFTDPKWKGKLSMEDASFISVGGAMFQWLLDLFGVDYWEKLAAQDVVITRGMGEISRRLAVGDDAVALAVHPTFLMRFIEEGAPVKFLILKEGVRSSTHQMSIPSTVPHANAAKVALNFMLTQEGQRTMPLSGNVPIRRDVTYAMHPEMERLVQAKIGNVQDRAGAQRQAQLRQDKVFAKIFPKAAR